VPAVAWVAAAEPQPEAALAAAAGRRQAAVQVAAAVRLPAEPDEAAARLRVAEVAALGGAEVPLQEEAAEVRDAVVALPRAARGGREGLPWAPASAALPWIRCRAGPPARSPAEPAPHKREG
jgi:hypothetical protein